MSLSTATFRGDPLQLPGSPPFTAADLMPLMGRAVRWTSTDSFVHASGTRAHAYLDAARESWDAHPEYMNFLDEDSPVWALKRAERDLALHHWEAHLDAATVLDVGCGIGRFTQRFLDRGATVHGVDPDEESLRRCLWHAAGRAGQLDLHWASVQALPQVEVDLALCAEVLCYVPDVERAMAEVVARVRPGGHVLISVEARWGWAAAQDAPPGSLEQALGGDGVVDRPGDRWVQTYDEARLRSLLEGAGLVVGEVIPSHWIPDGPLEDTAPDELSLEELLVLEQRCRAHPVWSPLHRLWLASGQKPR